MKLLVVSSTGGHLTDLVTLLADWGDAGSPADLNGDGVVGLGDLLILLSNWT